MSRGVTAMSGIVYVSLCYVNEVVVRVLLRGGCHGGTCPGTACVVRGHGDSDDDGDDGDDGIGRMEGGDTARTM